MARTLVFGPRDWGRCRFVRSVSWEVQQAARALVVPGARQYHRAWLDSIDTGAAVARLPVLLALNPHPGWTPDFLTPPARHRHRSFAAELSELSGVEPDRVAREARRSLASRPIAARRRVLGPLLPDPAGLLARVLDEFDWLWRELVEPWWPRIGSLIDSDIAFHTDRAGRLGMEATLADLHPRLMPAPDGLDLAGPEQRRIELGGHGLAMLPSAFVWPAITLVDEDRRPPMLVYPARGVGELWTASDPAPARLSLVLGHTRARLLSDVDDAATTSVLATRNGLSLPTASTQLRRLQSAGLIEHRRTGRQVRYRRSPLGEALLRGVGP